jgi:hypothetical protein
MFPAIANSLDEKQAGIESGLFAMGYCLALAPRRKTKPLRRKSFNEHKEHPVPHFGFTPKLLKPQSKRGYREAEL